MPATAASTARSGARPTPSNSGLFRRRGIRALGIAGYPEGHPKIGNDALFKALAEKIAAAEATGLAVEIVTQFCFDARAILDYVARLRGFGFEQPLRIGLVGPTSLSALLRYAGRCGVRASAQALARRSGMLRQMFALTVPDDLMRALAEAAPARVSVHFFSFGGLPATARWAQAVADGRIALRRSGRIHSRAAAAGGLISPHNSGGEDAGREHSRREYRLRDRGRPWPLGGADHGRPARAR